MSENPSARATPRLDRKTLRWVAQFLGFLTRYLGDSKVMNYSKSVRNPKPVEDPIPLRILITGDRLSVQATVDQLCALGFCDRARWSPILPQVNGQGYFSILTR